MNKKALDEKYSYQIDEHNIVHLFRGEVECQEFLTNSLLSAIFKIETLEKENAELKARVENQKSFLERIRVKFELGEIDRKEIEGYLESEHLTKAKEIIKTILGFMQAFGYSPSMDKFVTEAEQFLKDSEVEK